MLISKNHLKTRFTASKDTTRPVLTSIQITKEKDEVVAVATDGYVLSEVREQTPDDTEFPKVGPLVGANEYKLRATTANTISKSIKSNKHLPVLNYGHVGLDSITTTDLEHTQEFTDAKIEGNFPDYKQLIPESSEALATVKVNPAYLAVMAKVFKDESGVTIEFHGKDKAVVLRSSENEHDILGVIMPLKR